MKPEKILLIEKNMFSHDKVTQVMSTLNIDNVVIVDKALDNHEMLVKSLTDEQELFVLTKLTK